MPQVPLYLGHTLPTHLLYYLLSYKHTHDHPARFMGSMLVLSYMCELFFFSYVTDWSVSTTYNNTVSLSSNIWIADHAKFWPKTWWLIRLQTFSTRFKYLSNDSQLISFHLSRCCFLLFLFAIFHAFVVHELFSAYGYDFLFNLCDMSNK